MEMPFLDPSVFGYYVAGAGYGSRYANLVATMTPPGEPVIAVVD